MAKILNFGDALKKRTDDQGAKRQILDADFVRQAIQEDEVDEAIAKLEMLHRAWRNKKGPR